MVKDKTDRKESIILYGSQLDMLSELPGEDFKRFVLDIYNYSLTGDRPDFDDYENGLAAKMAYKAVSYQVDRDKKSYSEACGRQRERALKRWKGDGKPEERRDATAENRMQENAAAYHGIKLDTGNAEQEQEQEQEQDNKDILSGKPDDASSEDTSDNNSHGSVKQKEPTTKKPDLMPAVNEIVSYLNAKAGTNYRPYSRSTSELIKGRLDERFTVDDFKKVIDNMTAQWKGDPKMEPYLRPETLFKRSHFESYLNTNPKPAVFLNSGEPTLQRKPPNRFQNFPINEDNRALTAKLIAMQTATGM